MPEADTGAAPPYRAPEIDAEVYARWRLTAGPVLADRPSGTWEATRDGAVFIVKYFDDASSPDWQYASRVAAALRALGWPTPEPVEAPLIGPHGAWALFRRLPGRSVQPTEQDQPAERRARGRLLAELHAAAASTGIDDQRGGFRTPADVVTDPELEHLLRRHEMSYPDQGVVLRRCQEATASWFIEHPRPGCAAQRHPR